MPPRTLRLGRCRIATTLSFGFLAGFATGCDLAEQPLLGPDGANSQFAKPGACPGHPSCKPEGDPGDTPSGTVQMSVEGTLVVDEQAVDLSKDNQSTLELQEAPGFSGELAYDLVADTTANLQSCVTDPGDLAATDPGAVARLIERLSDAEQTRSTFVVVVSRNSMGNPNKSDGWIFQTWTDDGDGNRYRTRLTSSSLLPGLLVTVEENAADVFTFTGGSIVSWDTTNGQSIACPNAGSVEVALTRAGA